MCSAPGRTELRIAFDARGESDLRGPVEPISSTIAVVTLSDGALLAASATGSVPELGWNGPGGGYWPVMHLHSVLEPSAVKLFARQSHHYKVSHRTALPD